MVNASTPRGRRALALHSAIAIGFLVALAEACGQTSGTGAGTYEGGLPVQGGNSSGTPAPLDDSGGSAGEPSGDAGAPAAASGAGTGQGQEGDAGTTPAPTDASTRGSPDSGPTVVSCPATVLQPGDSNGSLISGGTMRTYILHVPTG